MPDISILVTLLEYSVIFVPLPVFYGLICMIVIFSKKKSTPPGIAIYIQWGCAAGDEPEKILF
jgi:hypothetical protein